MRETKQKNDKENMNVYINEVGQLMDVHQTAAQ